MDSNYILIVDDNPDAREIMGTILEAGGYHVQFAIDGKDALDCINRHPPDMILMDLMMPRMNGFQLLHRLQENSKRRHIPIIVISAIANDALSNLPGVSCVIQKSLFSASQLQTTVTDYLTGHSKIN